MIDVAAEICDILFKKLWRSKKLIKAHIIIFVFNAAVFMPEFERKTVQDNCRRQAIVRGDRISERLCPVYVKLHNADKRNKKLCHAAGLIINHLRMNPHVPNPYILYRDIDRPVLRLHRKIFIVVNG